jgi:hypothetical protein
MFVCPHTCFHTQASAWSYCEYVCLLQGAQVGKHVCRQSRQGVALKVELPVGEEGDTRSASHPSTPAQPNRMRVAAARGGRGCGRATKKKECKVPAQPQRRHKCQKKTATHPLGHMTRCLCVHTHASTHKQAHGATVKNVCLLQGAQAGKHVCRQRRQVVVVKVEVPVGEEGDTRSASHPSTPAQSSRMRVRSNKRWERVLEGEKKERVQSARTTPEKANVVNTGTHVSKEKQPHSPWGT